MSAPEPPVTENTQVVHATIPQWVPVPPDVKLIDVTIPYARSAMRLSKPVITRTPYPAAERHM